METQEQITDVKDIKNILRHLKLIQPDVLASKSFIMALNVCNETSSRRFRCLCNCNSKPREQYTQTPFFPVQYGGTVRKEKSPKNVDKNVMLFIIISFGHFIISTRYSTIAASLKNSSCVVRSRIKGQQQLQHSCGRRMCSLCEVAQLITY